MAGKRGRGTGERPHTWIVGEDPVRHDQYTAWLKARSQAWYRGEQYDISFEDWVDLWGTNWHLRGRERDALMLMKRRWQEPWSKRNAQLVNRDTFHQRQSRIKRERKALKNEQGSKV
jgi:hypothetical protein